MNPDQYTLNPDQYITHYTTAVDSNGNYYAAPAPQQGWALANGQTYNSNAPTLTWGAHTHTVVATPEVEPEPEPPKPPRWTFKGF